MLAGDKYHLYSKASAYDQSAVLATQLLVQMVNNFAVLQLRAEQYDFSILTYLYGMPWRPIEEITSDYILFYSISIGDSNLTFNKVSPMRRLTKVVFKAF